MKRLMLSVDDRKCAFGCTYCFASFAEYEKQTLLSEVEEDPTKLNDVDLIYPACDTDLFARNDFEAILSRLPALDCSVSISTKAFLGRRAERPIRECHRRLAERGHLLKISVSISTKTMVATVEPHTPSYSARIRSLKALRNWNIPRSLAFRPLLAEVADEEYLEILNDCAELTDLVLLGDEWLSQNEARPERFPNPRSESGSREVSWLRTKPSWKQRVVPGRAGQITIAAKERGYFVFDSDLALVESLHHNG